MERGALGEHLLCVDLKPTIDSVSGSLVKEFHPVARWIEKPARIKAFAETIHREL
jgi:hypothetical protein